jgi:pyruvate dehydrogenase (quinone)
MTCETNPYPSLDPRCRPPPDVQQPADLQDPTGITTSLLGKPVLDEALPFHTGVLGHLGTTAGAELMRECDTLLLLCTNDPWTEFYPAPGQAQAVQIDIDGRQLGVRYPVEVA